MLVSQSQPGKAFIGNIHFVIAVKALTFGAPNAGYTERVLFVRLNYVSDRFEIDLTAAIVDGFTNVLSGPPGP